MALSEAQLPKAQHQEQVEERELVGIDLAHQPQEHGDGRLQEASYEGWRSPSDPPPGGFASPWGHRFYPAASSDAAPEALRVSVHDLSEYARGVPTIDPRAGGKPGERLAQTVSVASPHNEGEELTLVIGPGSAQVFAGPQVWEEVAEPILLIVSQYARYASIEQSFIDLQTDARRDYRHAASAGLRTLFAQRRLVDAASAVRLLVSDWTYFAGPCADPLRICSSQESLEVYSILATELDFDGWTQRIDAVVEDVEQTYEAVSDKLFHYRLFMWGMAVEGIVVGLIAGLFVR